MAYATVEDVQNRIVRTLSEREEEICEMLLEDAVDIINAYNKDADEDAKKAVSISMVKRLLGSSSGDLPIGATQGTVSALGYSQSFTFSGGGSGEMYLSKVDKKLLGVSNKIGSHSPLEVQDDTRNNCCSL